jgi:hypothetical protein
MITLEELEARGMVSYLRGSKTPFVLYKGLIELAHDKGLQSIETEPVEMNWEKNRFVFKATVTGKDGQVFVEYGDTTQTNVGNKNIAQHNMRMALTRAKGRALRDFVGIGYCTKEELEIEEANAQLVDPSWVDDQPFFMGNLKEIGMKYADVVALCKQVKRPVPSQMSSDQRKKLISYLQDNKEQLLSAK